MRWSWRILTVTGIGIYIHVTFWILVVWVAVNYYLVRARWEDALIGVGFIASLFTIIVLHELGHALTARRFGIRTRDITLLPIGGVARLERMPDEPFQELLVALAGPAVNVVLAALLGLVLIAAGGPLGYGQLIQVGGNFLTKLLWINVIIVLFNLLPAFPMDGGRVLRALLAIKMDYVRATNVAAYVGQGMAILFGLGGLLSMNPFLLFIALFVWMGAAQEAGVVQMRSALGGIPVRQVMLTQFRTLTPRDPLARAVEHLLAGSQQDFPVVDDGQVVGVLTRSDLIGGLTRHGQDAPVSEVMRREFETADPSEPAESVFSRLQKCECHSVPVVRGNQLLGIMTMENLGEFLMIQAALQREPEARRLGAVITGRREA